MVNTMKIEIFSAGCPLCKETVELVKRLTCPSREVTLVKMQDIQGHILKYYGCASVMARNNNIL